MIITSIVGRKILKELSVVEISLLPTGVELTVVVVVAIEFLTTVADELTVELDVETCTRLWVAIGTLEIEALESVGVMILVILMLAEVEGLVTLVETGEVVVAEVAVALIVVVLLMTVKLGATVAGLLTLLVVLTLLDSPLPGWSSVEREL